MCKHADNPESRPALERVRVVGNERIAPGVGILTLQAPRCASEVSPGQFVHLRVAEGRDFILRRPFSVHRAYDGMIEILYQVLGVGTRAISLLEREQTLDLVGPLGRGWSAPEGLAHALIVTGGLGAAPLGMLAEELAAAGVAVTVAMGAPTQERLVARGLYETVVRRVVLATDDGSAGERGFVTAPVKRLLAESTFDQMYVCGPEVMQRLVADMAKEANVPCQVSLERLMACGIGACLSCVVSTRDGLKRACVDGPVFDAEDVLWDSSEVPPKH
ncbi:MAG: dihydroorotate dehydrogenase electron transfer subunit [Actinobacteria bacterium]|nr:dihydroorotate dehydrogenase electron transfer subunit [Actinomycetota bacterium]MCG2806994.1 dihydroorotate dehydrogenase electron transfer subunit [Coriobacteriia bacterium]